MKDRLARFVEWRRDNGGWVYACLAGSWLGLTVVTADATGWGWRFVAGSAAAFVLLFEVGLAYVLAAAWGSHRLLEREGEVAELIRLLEVEELTAEQRSATLLRLTELGQPIVMEEE